MASEKKISDSKLKDKLEDWREAMSRMTLKELLKMKFSYDASEKWQVMYTPYRTGKKSSYYCSICKMVLIDGNAAKTHNGLNKHKTSLETKVFNLFHDTIDPFKSDNSEKKPEPVLESTKELTLQDMKNRLFTLTMAEILEVQYKIDDSWKQLIISLKSGYNCTICKSNLLTSIQGIRNHMQNRQHKSNMELIEELHHPTIFPMKASTIKQRQRVKSEKEDVEEPTATQEDSTEHKQRKENSTSKSKEALESPKKDFVKDSETPMESDDISDSKTDENVISENIGPIQISIKSIEKKTNEEPNKVTDQSKTSNVEVHEVDNTKSKTTESPITSALKSIQPEIQLKKKTINEFMHEMGSMRKDDILKVEYKGNDRKWNHIIVSDGPYYTCEICNVKKLKDIPLTDHIKGRKHKDKVRMIVVRFFHPVFTEPKELNKEEKKIEGNKSEIVIKEGEGKSTTKISKNKIQNENLIKITPVKSSPIEKKSRNDAEKMILQDEIEIVTVEDSPEKELLPPGTESPKSIVLNPVAMVTKKKNEESNQKKMKTNGSPNFQKKEFTTNIDDGIEGFVGVEYVIKIIKHATDNDPRFECCLCEAELNGTDMQHHLKGLTHRTKYLERHFSTCMKQFKDYRMNHTAMHQITDKICKAVEKYHGRDLPLECVQNDYRVNRRDYMDKVFSFRHASEMSGPSFTNIVDKNELQNIVKNRNYKIPEKNENKLSFTLRDNKRKTNYPFTTESDNRTSQHISKISNSRLPKKLSHYNSNDSNMLQHHQMTNYNPIFPSMAPNNMSSYEPSRPNYMSSYNSGFYPDIETRPNTQYQEVNDKFLDNEEHRRLAEKFIKSTKVSDKSDRYYRQTSHSPRRNRKSRSRSRSRRDFRSKSRSPLRENDVWQAYRRKFDIDVKIIDMDFQQYYKDPQAHPLYNEEWQTFWANRMNELKQAGRDCHKHDFTYEWSVYFPKRLEELYEKEVEALKITLRERFVLPMHNHELGDPRYHIKDIIQPSTPNSMVPVLARRSSPNNMKDRGRNSFRKSSDMLPDQPSPPFIHKRKSISIEKNIYEHENTELNRMNLNETNVKKRKKLKSRSPSPENDNLEKELENGSPTAISVLRVLTALEDNLGASLGPKIIDLMSKALVLEKTKPNAVDENLLTNDNCILLETCREKLKGQIVAGLYKNRQLRAAKNVIKDITNLVEKANEFRIKNERQLEVQNILRKVATVSAPKFSSAPRAPAKIVSKLASISNTRTSNQNSFGCNLASSLSSSNLSMLENTIGAKQTNVPSMSMVQKKELAKNLAQALAAQGKTSISTEHCEQLIEVYTLIDKKKQEGGKLDNQEKSLSECLQDCIKSGSLTNLTNLIQDKNKSSNQARQQHSKELDQMNSQVQSILKSINQSQSSNFQQNDYRNFSHLANFDTSLSFNSPSLVSRSSFGGGSLIGSNSSTHNSATQNWVQGSVLSGSNYNNSASNMSSNMPSNMSSNMPSNMSSNMSSRMGVSNTFGASTNDNQINHMSDFNMNNNYNRMNMSSGNWQRSDLNNSLGQQNNYQNQYGGGSGYNMQGRYNRR